MSIRSRLSHLFRQWFRRRQDDAILDEELRHFFDELVGRRMAAGLTREAATRAARAELGSTEAVREGVRDIAMRTRVESFWRDVRHATRLLRRNPGFTLAAVIPLALGIGTAATVYSAVYGVLLRPLPVTDERSLVIGYEVRPTGRNSLAGPRYQMWRESGVLADIAFTSGYSFNLVVDEVTEQVAGAVVSPSFFRVLGVSALRGRLLDEQDAAARASVAVISESLWRRRFADNAEPVGQTISANGRPLTIVGVAPAGFERWRGEAHLWVPAETIYEAKILSSDGYIIATPVGRLKPGQSAMTAEAAIAVVDAAYLESRGALARARANNVRVSLVPLRQDVVPPALRRTLAVLLVAVGLTVLVVCAHIINLTLARGMRRSSEIAVRLAIGAHRRRIVRQLAIESLVLSVPAGTAGWLMAYWGVQLLVGFGPPGIIDNDTIRLDLPVTLFAAALTVASALVSAIGPALRLSRTSLQSVQADRVAPRRLSGSLISLELALAVLVLIGASLLVKSFARMAAVDLGFDPRNLLTMRYDLRETIRSQPTNPASVTSMLQTQRDLLDRLGAVPGVDAVTLSGGVFRPMSDSRASIWLDDGRRFLNGEPAMRAFAPRSHRVGPGHFQMHGIQLLRGREFVLQDHATAPPVVVVSETMAEMLWPGQNAIGRRINFRGQSPINGKLTFTEPWAEVVGVVADVRYGTVDSKFLPEVYRAITQDPAAAGYVVVKTRMDPASVSPLVRQAIWGVDARIPIHAARTVDELIDESTAMTRYNAALLSLCAGITTLLCGFGLYGLLAYAVAARRRELGIRIALGADSRRLTLEVLGQAGRLLIGGLGAGLLVAAFATQVLSSLLFDVSPRDPLVFALAGALITMLAMVSAWLPARTAARLDPVRALKNE